MDLHHIHIDLPPKYGAALGFVMTGGVKIVNEMSGNAQSHLPSGDMIIDAFILGFVGALGGLVVSLIVRGIKWFWNRKKKE